MIFENVSNAEQNKAADNADDNDWPWLLIPVVGGWLVAWGGVYVCDNFFRFC